MDQLETLKTVFAQLPAEFMIEAIERMDQTVEQLAHSVVFVEDDVQAECLADMGKGVVEDFLNPSTFNFFDIGPSTSSEDFNFTSNATSSSSLYTSPILYCYTCGDGFNNRKGLYRHGKTTKHRTRPLRCNRNFEPSVDNSTVFVEQSLEFPLVPEPETSEFPEPEGIPNIQKPSEIPLESLGPRDLDFFDVGNFLENSEEGIREQSDEKSICFECKTRFSNRKALYRHGLQTSHRVRLKRSTKVKGGSIHCTKCIYSTDKIINLRAHYRRNHEENGIGI